MGRAELRRQARKQNKTATYVMTSDDIKRLKENMTRKVAGELLGTVLGFI